MNKMRLGIKFEDEQSTISIETCVLRLNISSDQIDEKTVRST